MSELFLLKKLHKWDCKELGLWRQAPHRRRVKCNAPHICTREKMHEPLPIGWRNIDGTLHSMQKPCQFRLLQLTPHTNYQRNVAPPPCASFLTVSSRAVGYADKDACRHVMVSHTHVAIHSSTDKEWKEAQGSQSYHGSSTGRRPPFQFWRCTVEDGQTAS